MVGDPKTSPTTVAVIDTEEKLIEHVNSLPCIKFDMTVAIHQMLHHLNPPLYVKRVPDSAQVPDPEVQVLNDLEITDGHYAHVSTETKGAFNEPVDTRNRHERRRDCSMRRDPRKKPVRRWWS